jgi:GH35 family endo-1,4-beta-xylanase
MHRFLFLLGLFTFAALHAEEPQLPPEAVPLLAGEPAKPTQPKPEDGGIVSVESPGAPVNPVLRVTALRKMAKAYELAVSRDFTKPIAENQVCLFVIKARTVASAAKDGKGKLMAVMQNRADYSASPLWSPVVIGKEWETHFFAFQAAHGVPEGRGTAMLVGGEQPQVIEIADFQVYRFPVGFDLFRAPRMKATYAGREVGASWRVEAEERIAKLRRGDLIVRVADAEGKPVPGAKVRVEMKRHLFGFGSAVDVGMLSALDEKIAPADQIKYRDTVDELFSRVVTENGLRVGNIDADSDPTRPWEAETLRRTRTAVLWTLQWAADRKMTSRGHYLVWGYAEKWAQDILRRGTPADLLAAYDRHFAFVIPFVKDYVVEWDALNHPVPFDEKDALYNIVGPDVYPDLYQKIRSLTPLPLYVNEDTFNAERIDGFEKQVRHMIEKGATPDGAGFQSHYSDYETPGMDDIWETWNRLARLVKYLTVTEYDFQSLDDQLHADHLRDLLTLAFSHPQMTGFVIWGFWEKRHWKPMAAMFKSDWTERPAVKVWRDLVKTRWWTKAELVSNQEGEAKLTGYYGWYDLTVEKGGKSATLVVKHAVSGGKPIVKLP